ncbi:MAG TPA: hypothetical protein VHA05_00670 [Candidatus Saccharimonadales bacterium]|jgi:hypothetical protein|nr:hypothetical protein [Candidatus Saccharimonadales bacterium]
MAKKTITTVVILLIALAVNILIYKETFTTPPMPLPSFAACAGSDQNPARPSVPETTDVKIGVMAGEPFKTDKNVKVSAQTCTSQYKVPTFRLGDFISSWQFYANWLIWSLPFFGVAYLISRHAHIRD